MPDGFIDLHEEFRRRSLAADVRARVCREFNNVLGYSCHNFCSWECGARRLEAALVSGALHIRKAQR